MKKLWIPAMLALTLAALVVPAQAGAVAFPEGVASGDVTSTRAVLWTKTDTATNIKVEGWKNAALSGPKAFQGKMKTSAARDLTVKIDQGGLTPNTQYWYRFKKDEEASDVGTFKTAPAANVPANVDFTWSGDSDATKVNGVNPFNNLEMLDRPRRTRTPTSSSTSATRSTRTRASVRRSRDDAGGVPQRLQGAPRRITALLNLQKSTSTYPLIGRPRGPERLRRSDRRPGSLRGRTSGVPRVHADP